MDGACGTAIMAFGRASTPNTGSALRPRADWSPPPRAASCPAMGPGGAGAFYKPFLQSVRDAGFDFVKIDVQAEYLKQADGLDNPVHHNTKCSEALEKACRQTGLELINWHGPRNRQHPEHAAQRRHPVQHRLQDGRRGHGQIPPTPVLRQHAVAGADCMARTRHVPFHGPASARLMAVSKAVSGGPVYLSDPADKLNPEHIMPLVWSDGLLLRPWPRRPPAGLRLSGRPE